MSVVTVMPSWAPESSKDRLRCARCTIFARRSPTSATWFSIWLRSRLVRENSAATKIAVPKVTATNPTRPSTDSRTSTIDRVPASARGQPGREPAGGDRSPVLHRQADEALALPRHGLAVGVPVGVLPGDRAEVLAQQVERVGQVEHLRAAL